MKARCMHFCGAHYFVTVMQSFGVLFLASCLLAFSVGTIPYMYSSGGGRAMMGGYGGGEMMGGYGGGAKMGGYGGRGMMGGYGGGGMMGGYGGGAKMGGMRGRGMMGGMGHGGGVFHANCVCRKYRCMWGEMYTGQCPRCPWFPCKQYDVQCCRR